MKFLEDLLAEMKKVSVKINNKGLGTAELKVASEKSSDLVV